VDDLYAQLLLYGLAAAFAAPIAAVVAALVLAKSTTPVVSAITFVVGALLLDLVVVVVFFALTASGMGGGNLGAWIDVLLGAMFLLLGIMAVVEKPDPVKDAKQQARVVGIASGGIATLLVAGLAVQVINFDAIAVMAGGLKEIVEAGATSTQRLIAVAFLLLVMLLPYWAPIAAFILARKRAVPALARMTEWILSNSRMLEIVCGFGFGVVFAFKGLVALLG
jgi:Sap, sulfolipid-1-addressing protein